MRSVQGRFGEIWFYGKDEYVGKSLYNYGEFSGEECEIINSLAAGTCLDIGANVGVIAQMLQYYRRKCIAFEPQPEIYKILTRNFNGTSYNAALGSTKSTAEMPRLRYGTRANYGGISLNTRSPLGSYTVPVITLDSLSIPDVGFIKIDVEGWEEEVLKGAVATINKYKPILYIEDDRQDKSTSLRKFITNLGYSIGEVVLLYIGKITSLVKKVNVWNKNYVSHNIICRPL